MTQKYLRKTTGSYFNRSVIDAPVEPDKIEINILPRRDEVMNIQNEHVNRFFKSLYEGVESRDPSLLSSYIGFESGSYQGKFDDNTSWVLFSDGIREVFETDDEYMIFVGKVYDEFYSLNKVWWGSKYFAHSVLRQFSLTKEKVYLDIFLHIFYNKKITNPIDCTNSRTANPTRHIIIGKDVLEAIRSFNLDDKKIKYLLKIFICDKFHEYDMMITGDHDIWMKKYDEERENDFVECAYNCLDIFPEQTLPILNGSKKNFEGVFKRGLLVSTFNERVFRENVDNIDFRKYGKIYNPGFLSKLQKHSQNIHDIIVSNI